MLRLKFLLAILAFILAGCFGSKSFSWQEDVVLPDGRVVTLNRTQHFDDRGYVAAHSFEFQHPTTGQAVRWDTDGFFRLVALFMSAEVPHILVKPTFGSHNEHAGCPYPSMFIYRFVGTSWQQLPYAASPLRRLENNTTIDPSADAAYIKSQNFKISPGGVKVISDPAFQHYYGIDLDKFPAQVFHCLERKELKFQ